MSVNTSKHISIIGAGISGLLTAICLKKSGFNQVTIYEKSDLLQESETAFILWPNATRILKKLDLLEPIRKQGNLIRQSIITMRRGKQKYVVSYSGYEDPVISISRNVLYRELQKCISGTALKTGFNIWDIGDLSNGGTMLYFTNESEVMTDVLIGADGVNSEVRKILWEEEPLDYCGYSTWRGVAPVTPLGINQDTLYEIWGAGKRFGIIPLGTDKTGWWGTANESLSKPSHSGKRKKKLIRTFGGWDHPVPGLLDATEEHLIAKNHCYDADPEPVLGEGPITLTGDAAHPIAPDLSQGGCMAMEDAVILSNCLMTIGKTTDALRRYEQLRYKRVRYMKDLSSTSSNTGQIQNKLIVPFRNRFLHLLLPMLKKNKMERVFGYNAFNEKA